MNDSPNRGRGYQLLPFALLAGYWLALCVATHLPPEFPGLPPEGYDKIVHFSSFAGLAALLALAWWALWGPLPLGSVWRPG
jgi:hypothetical protein